MGSYALAQRGRALAHWASLAVALQSSIVSAHSTALRARARSLAALLQFALRRAQVAAARARGDLVRLYRRLGLQCRFVGRRALAGWRQSWDWTRRLHSARARRAPAAVVRLRRVVQLAAAAGAADSTQWCCSNEKLSVWPQPPTWTILTLSFLTLRFSRKAETARAPEDSTRSFHRKTEFAAEKH